MKSALLGAFIRSEPLFRRRSIDLGESYGARRDNEDHSGGGAASGIHDVSATTRIATADFDTLTALAGEYDLHYSGTAFKSARAKNCCTD
jgi:hypothetical protein